VSENSSTPEESEATGRVTTDGSAPSAGSPAQASSPATASEVNGAAAGNGAVSKGSSNGAATPAEPAPDGAGKAAAAASDETQVDETQPEAAAPSAPAEPAGPMSGAGLFKPASPGPSAGPVGSPAPSGEAADPPTVVTSEPAAARQPAPPRGSGGAPANGVAPRPPVPGPRPAPGPVPGPGPEAAPPPPWQRVPGHEPREARDAPGRAATVGDLLGDGPTVVMGPQGAGHPGEQPRTSGPGSATGGWQAVRATRNRTPRQAALQLKRLDPWSVLKLSLVLAVVLFFIWLVAVGVLYGVLDGMGVWDQLNGNYANLVTENAPAGGQLINAGRVFGFAAVVGAINSLLFAVAMTISAFVYNVSADLVGGVEVTLSERD
jgi:hypothetical protein